MVRGGRAGRLAAAALAPLVAAGGRRCRGPHQQRSIPLELYTVLHFGHLLPPHIAGNPGLLEGDWLSMRRSLFSTWFVSQGRSNFWRVAPAILLAFVWRPTSYFGGAARRGRPFLLAVALITASLVVLSAPNDGGAQWAPRYLLLVYLPMTILATDTLAYVVAVPGHPPAGDAARGKTAPAKRCRPRRPGPCGDHPGRGQRVATAVVLQGASRGEAHLRAPGRFRGRRNGAGTAGHHGSSGGSTRRPPRWPIRAASSSSPVLSRPPRSCTS